MKRFYRTYAERRRRGHTTDVFRYDGNGVIFLKKVAKKFGWYEKCIYICDVETFYVFRLIRYLPRGSKTEPPLLQIENQPTPGRLVIFL